MVPFIQKTILTSRKGFATCGHEPASVAAGLRQAAAAESVSVMHGFNTMSRMTTEFVFFLSNVERRNTAGFQARAFSKSSPNQSPLWEKKPLLFALGTGRSPHPGRPPSYPKGAPAVRPVCPAPHRGQHAIARHPPPVLAGATRRSVVRWPHHHAPTPRKPRGACLTASRPPVRMTPQTTRRVRPPCPAGRARVS